MMQWRSMTVGPSDELDANARGGPGAKAGSVAIVVRFTRRRKLISHGRSRPSGIGCYSVREGASLASRWCCRSHAVWLGIDRARVGVPIRRCPGPVRSGLRRRRRSPKFPPHYRGPARHRWANLIAFQCALDRLVMLPPHEGATEATMANPIPAPSAARVSSTRVKRSKMTR